MNGELKDFVLRKQDEHTKNLALFKTFERIRYFGKNVFIIGGIDDPDDSDLSGPIEKVIHVAILLACLLLIGVKYWIIKALIVYALIHIFCRNWENISLILIKYSWMKLQKNVRKD